MPENVFTKENLETFIRMLKEGAAKPYPIHTFEMPPISPRYLPELIKRGYVKDDKWTDAGIEWYFGIPVRHK